MFYICRKEIKIMKKKHQIVMLPTVKARIQLAEESNKLHLLNTENKSNLFTPQHLYILSDEDIEEGDWIILTHVKQLRKSKKEEVRLSEDKRIEWKAKKVIATTDKTIAFKTTEAVKKSFNEGTDYRDRLPKIPESFLPIFIETYNEGNPITEVELDHESKYPNTIEGHEVMPNILKTTESNEVIISLPKENQMEQELKKLRQKYVDAELKHYRETGEKSKALRAKVSVLTELANNLSTNLNSPLCGKPNCFNPDDCSYPKCQDQQINSTDSALDKKDRLKKKLKNN